MSSINDGEIQRVDERDALSRNNRFIVHALEAPQWKARMAAALIETHEKTEE